MGKGKLTDTSLVSIAGLKLTSPFCPASPTAATKFWSSSEVVASSS
jgi:hypothetical protein